MGSALACPGPDGRWSSDSTAPPPVGAAGDGEGDLVDGLSVPAGGVAGNRPGCGLWTAHDLWITA